MESQYTSLELAKKLDEVGFSEIGEFNGFAWDDMCHDEGDYKLTYYMEYVATDNSGLGVNTLFDRCKDGVAYPAYDLLWDLCIRYKEEVWGDDVKVEQDYEVCAEYHTDYILAFLQQGEKEKAEEYILQNSILFIK